MAQEHEHGDSAGDAVVHDQNQLRTLVQAAIQDVERTDLLSPSLIAPLAHHLLARFHQEETELFPRIERVAGDLLLSEIASLRREHLVLREFLSETEAALTRRDRAGARGNLLELATCLRLHCAREDGLYRKTPGQ